MKKRAFSLIELSIVILIIGILVAGVTQGSRLISQFRLQNARNLTQGSPVASIKGLVVWYEASSEISFSESEQENEAEITSWNDINPQTTFKINATSTLTARPKYVSSCINSIPCVRFDGVNDTLALSEDSFLNGSDYSIFVVASRDGTSETNYFLAGSDTGTKLNLHLGYRSNETLTHDRGGIDLDLTVAGFQNKIPRIHTALFSQEYSAENDNTVYELNGGTGGNKVISDDGDPLISWANANIGRYFPSGFYYKGDISEIIIFTRRLKTKEINDIRNYLSKKYNISL